MLSCKEISHLASDHIDNTLPPLMKMKVKMHLFMCHHCRNFIKQFDATVGTLKQLTPAQPNAEFIDEQVLKLVKIAKNLNQEQAGEDIR